MPAPSTIDREAVEAALPDRVRAALPALAELWGVRVDRWPDHPLLGDFLSLTAAVALQERERGRGHSYTQALRLACGRLGLGYEAVERRLRRVRQSYLAAHESRTICPPRARDAGATSEQTLQGKAK